MPERLLFLDCFSGISGDMTVGALIDLGVKPSVLQWELAKLELEGMHMHFERQERQMVTGVKFTVHDGGCPAEEKTFTHTHSRGETETGGSHSHSHSHAHTHTHEHSHSHSHEHHHDDHDHVHGRTHGQIRALIEASELSDFVKTKALAIFQRIAVAEGRIHGVPPDDVGFHEVGAVDSIVDIVAVCVAMEALGKPEVVATPLFDGKGWIQCAHGQYPIPAMATLEILKGIPFRQIDENFEFVTPTGAAIVAEFVTEFQAVPEMQVESIGYGLGTKHLPNRPNALRAMLGMRVQPGSGGAYDTDRVTLLETNLDDLSPEFAGALVQRLLDEGALDVWHTPIVMKKSRPGFLLSLLAGEEDAERLAGKIFRETSAFGIRRTAWDRWKLQRQWETVEWQGQSIRIKIGRAGEETIQAAPEFDDCLAASEALDLPVREVYHGALAAYHG